VSAGELHVIVPGPLAQRTGGYLYDARIAEGLTAAGFSAEEAAKIMGGNWLAFFERSFGPAES
jgi:hypothetical protein